MQDLCQQFIEAKIPNKELWDIFRKQADLYEKDVLIEAKGIFLRSTTTRDEDKIIDDCSKGKLAEILIKELFQEEFIEVREKTLLEYADKNWLKDKLTPKTKKITQRTINHHDLIRMGTGEIIEMKRWALNGIDTELKKFLDEDCQGYNFSHWLVICTYDNFHTWIHSIHKLR